MSLHKEVPRRWMLCVIDVQFTGRQAYCLLTLFPLYKHDSDWWWMMIWCIEWNESKAGIIIDLKPIFYVLACAWMHLSLPDTFVPLSSCMCMHVYGCCYRRFLCAVCLYAHESVWLLEMISGIWGIYVLIR